ncbi:beta-ketoacyl-[acyl-carrier-protein] synthase family protein [Streptomyces gobiensis]|uniref:beta-ketoacyl-[acyl-carrier-protein] synthase family protein n=1 Tax=Streptomyces gobiensis TaxID=2875706 RepID=UPI001E56C997|nr:beta-ketoacyl synthase N-terminal-like domain-containing protein [Streptomyces gobiensis]UGY94147.1 ketoacyl synthase [Streptomyces gobiensis]
MSVAAGWRDVLVTGMGFCLPGPDGTVCRTSDDLWRTVSTGRSNLDNDGFFYGHVPLTEEEFSRAVPELPARFLKNYASIHLYGLLALVEACDDAALDWRGTELADAAVLTGRVGVDNSFDTYLDCVRASPDALTPQEARSLFMRLAVSVTATDVATVQASLLRSGGPNYTLSCGCASTAALLGVAANQIASGEVDIAVVTGVDAFNLDRVEHFEELRAVAERSSERPSFQSPPTQLRFDRPMRPYDERADGFNIGEGAATLILESREHAERRGRRAYGQILGQSTMRGAVASAITANEDGDALVRAARNCLRARDSHARIAPAEVPVVNGGAQGDPLFNTMEFNAIRSLYGLHGTDSVGPLVSTQEACFGHNAAPLGNVGAAATLLMMRNGQVCPTANCEKVSEDCPFDLVTGAQPRPLDFDLALSFNYQMGGVSSALLLTPAERAVGATAPSGGQRP